MKLRITIFAVLAIIASARVSHAQPVGTWQWVATAAADCTPPVATCIATADSLQPYVQMSFEFIDRPAFPAHFSYSAVTYANVHATFDYYESITHTKIGKRFVGDGTWIVWITYP